MFALGYPVYYTRYGATDSESLGHILILKIHNTKCINETLNSYMISFQRSMEKFSGNFVIYTSYGMDNIKNNSILIDKNK